jgi:Lon protease-like protein
MFESSIPIFPLHNVLFPGMSLRLNIFEERYKNLIKDLEYKDQDKFGISLIKRGREVGGTAVPFDIGTLGIVKDIRELENGNYKLTVNGEKRFRILEIEQNKPYIVARVTAMPDAEYDVKSKELISLIRETYEIYAKSIIKLNGGWSREIDIPSDNDMLVSYITSVIFSKMAQKQEVLESDSVSASLGMVLAMIRNELPWIDKEIDKKAMQRMDNLN